MILSDILKPRARELLQGTYACIRVGMEEVGRVGGREEEEGGGRREGQTDRQTDRKEQ